jgi:hypothetical protein
MIGTEAIPALERFGDERALQRDRIGRIAASRDRELDHTEVEFVFPPFLRVLLDYGSVRSPWMREANQPLPFGMG